MAAPNHKYFYNTGFQAVATIKNQETSTNQPQLPNSDSPFPILAIVILSIMGIAFLLIGYYFFVTKCSHNSWQRINLLRQISIFQRGQTEESFIAFSPAMWNNRGLDDSLIHDIPTFLFRKEGEKEEEENRCIFSCVVCLSEFKEEDMLRVLPNCSHAFHLDCIDIWLQGNSNCPLCRTNILSTTRCSIINQIIAPRSSPQGSQQYTDSLMGGDDEDFVVIELGGDGQQERHNSSEVSSLQLRNQSPKILEENPVNLKAKKRQHVSIMGDECIDVRESDEQFLIQPIRRSFSLDSAADRQLYLTVQAIIQQNGHSRQSNNNTEECSSTRLRRSFVSFGHGRGTKNAVLPVNFEI